MSRELVAHNKPVFDQLHPRTYGAAVGLVAWFALMAWALFDRSSDIGLSLMFVTVLFIVAVLLPWTLFLVWKKFQMPYERHPQPTSFHEWRAGDFAVWGARSGAQGFTAPTPRSTFCCRSSPSRSASRPSASSS